MDPRQGALHDLGGWHKYHGRLQEAEAALRAALAMAPDVPRTRHALGIVLLSQGRYREGWPLYDARHEIPELALSKPTFPYPEWHGEDLAGKNLLIFPEQGAGDQIMFARFADYAKRRGADVTLITNPALARLFEGLRVRILPAVGALEFPDPDYWVMSGSIAGRACRAPDDVPGAPYLRAPNRLGTRSGIGIMSRGNPAHSNDANRSLSEAEAAPLLALPGAIDLDPAKTGVSDFADTADLIAGLDLVISADTAVAHLAGAMGKRTWILIPALMTDWRWMSDQPHSPWYPSATLHRQRPDEPWASVVARVLEDVARDGLR